MNPITMQIVADKYIRMALEEDINSEDVSTNAVMPRYQLGTVNTADIHDTQITADYLASHVDLHQYEDQQALAEAYHHLATEAITLGANTANRKEFLYV